MPAHPAFLSGGGAAGASIRGHDWSATSLGAPESWPASLRTAVALMLASREPAYIGWGPDLLSFYNDGYLPILRDKHPGIALPFASLWAELWDELRPLIERTLGGETQHFANMPFTLAREGRPDGFFSFMYAPIRDDGGAIAGFYCTARETTEQVLEELRQSIVLRTSEQLVAARSMDEVVDVLRQTARAAIGAEGIAIVLEEDGRCFYVAEDAIAPLWQGRRFDADACISGWAMRHGETVAISDVLADTRIPQEAYRPTFVRSLVLAPIGRPRAIAALGAYWSDVRTHDRGTVDRLEGLARLASLAIENARLIQARDRAAALSAAQSQVLELAVGSASFPETLDAIVATVESLSTSDVLGSILLLDPDGVHLRHGAAPSLPPAYNHAIDGIASGEGVGSCGTAIARSAPVFVSNIASDPLWADFKDLALEHELRACWSIPIRSPQGEVLGTFAMYHREPREPLPADLEIVDFVVRTAGLVIDRARSEAARREDETRLRIATDNAEVGFWDVDEVNQILHWPPIVKAMFGISAHVPVSMTDFYAGLHPEDADATAEAYACAADPDRRGLYDVEYRAIGKEDGITRWIAAKGRGVFDEDGRCIRVTGTAIDITRRKAMEERLRDLNDTLEKRVVAAVAEREAAQDALRQSQKMEAMGQLTGGVAHDFNNLLTPIVGSLDMLQRKGLGGEREQRLIAGAMQSAERAKTLVQRLLAFARRQPLQPVATDIAKLVQGMGELIASTTGPQIKVVVDAADGLPPAKADPNQLEMALLNLAVNARDAMPDGGTLRISATAHTVVAEGRPNVRPGAYIRLSVADTGLGMDEATLARAVEPFFSTKGVGRGTGLGLSMVHGLASQLGGTLTIRSKVGLGTNMELWLPQSGELPQSVEPTPTSGPTSVRSGIALLVEDEDVVRMSTSDMLSDLGYVVKEAASAEEALRLVDDGESFDLLVTDHLMPGMSGTDLVREICARRPGTPSLLVSGYAENDGIDPDLQRLVKPFRKDELATSLSRLLHAC